MGKNHPLTISGLDFNEFCDKVEIITEIENDNDPKRIS